MTTRLHPVYGTPLPGSWQVLQVDDVKSPEPSSCVAGPFGSNIASKYFAEQGIPVIRGGNLTDDLTQFVAEGFVFVSQERAKQYRAQHVRAGDLVFTCWGTIGQVGRIPEDGPFPEYIISNKQLKLRANPAVADSRFLFYYFASPNMVAYIRGRAVGSAVPGINLGILKSLPVALPPLSTQQRIASILSAYDDLIENNTRRIQILEQMAQAIYREWFVEFRFPGHQDVRMVDSELGPIPEGWRACSLGELTTNFDRFRRPLSSLRRAQMPGPFPYYGAAKIFDFVDDYIFDGTYLLLAEDGSVMTSDGLPVLQYVTGKFWANNHTHILQGQGVSTEYLYLALRGIQISGYVTGAAQPKITQANLNRIPVIAPSHDHMAAFDRTIKPMFELMESLKQSIVNLRVTRDLLLPRLISGDIDVSNLDIGNAEPAA